MTDSRAAGVQSIGGAVRSQDHPILLFDGVCNLCHAGVRFVLDNERTSDLRFASLQSDVAQALLAPFGIDAGKLESMVLVQDGRALQRSDAILALASHLRAPYRWASVLGVVPRFVRDPLYKLMARTRYAVFGQRDACAVPAPGAPERFLDAGELSGA